MFVDEFHDKHRRVWMDQVLITSEEATEAYMVKVLAESHCYSSNSFLVGFQHVCEYGKAKMSGIAGTVRHAPGLEYGQNATSQFLPAAIEETESLIRKPPTEVREGKKWGVEFPGHKQVKATIERHRAMLRRTQTDWCIPYQTCTANNPQTCWRHKGTGAAPPDRRRQPTPQPTPPLPGMLPLLGTQPAPPSHNARAQPSQIVNSPAGYMSSHSSPPCTEFFRLDAYAQDSQHDTDFDLDMLTDEGTSTG